MSEYIRVALVRKPDNYCFFDPESRVHLTLESPVSRELDRLTVGLQRGIDSKVIYAIQQNQDVSVSAFAERDPAATHELISKASKPSMLGEDEEETAVEVNMLYTEADLPEDFDKLKELAAKHDIKAKSKKDITAQLLALKA